ncbi:hypothetical protein NKH77_55865 [Streptomyces sp. M19]
MHTARVPGPVYGALHACHPPGTLPAWLTGRGPRCATGAAVDVAQEHAEELAPLLWGQTVPVMVRLSLCRSAVAR